MKDYMVQFKAVKLKVYNLDKSIVMLAMKRGLHSSYFTFAGQDLFEILFRNVGLCYRSTFIWIRELSLNRRLMRRQKRSELEESQAEPQAEKLDSFH